MTQIDYDIRRLNRDQLTITCVLQNNTQTTWKTLNTWISRRSFLKPITKCTTTSASGFLKRYTKTPWSWNWQSTDSLVVPRPRWTVFYEYSEVGFYKADIIVNNLIIIEGKAAENLCEENELQLINYLKASEIEV